MCVATGDGSRASAGGSGEGKVAVTCGNTQPRILMNVMPTSGGQGVASSNLASPTRQLPSQTAISSSGFMGFMIGFTA
jgi:hypothetical protein